MYVYIYIYILLRKGLTKRLWIRRHLSGCDPLTHLSTQRAPPLPPLHIASFLRLRAHTSGRAGQQPGTDKPQPQPQPQPQTKYRSLHTNAWPGPGHYLQDGKVVRLPTSGFNPRQSQSWFNLRRSQIKFTYRKWVLASCSTILGLFVFCCCCFTP